jgi:type I restriction enzyme S subunit
MNWGMRDKEMWQIPTNWQIKKFGEVGETIIGLTYSPKDVAEEGLLVLRSSNVRSNSLKYTDNVFVSKKVNDRIITRENDILICVRNGSRNLIGKCALIKGRAVGETFGAFMSIFRSDFNWYIFHVMQSDFIKKQIEQHIGATINQITNNNLNNFIFPEPPLPQQRKIAKILTTCDAVIEKTEAAIAKYQAIKQGMMHDLFTRGIDLSTGQLRPKYEDAPELYKESELGWIPKEWDVKRLEQFVQLKSGDGITSKNISESGDYPVYGGNGLRGYTDKYTHDGTYVLIGRQGALCGNITFTYGKFFASEHAVVVTILNDSHVKWIEHKLYSMNLNQYSEASAQPGLSVNKIVKLRVVIPHGTEQTEIANRLSSLESKIKSEQSTLSKYRQIKAGLMQDLLSGKVEVRVSKEETN